MVSYGFESTPEFERGFEAQCLPATANRLTYRFARQERSILYAACEQRILPSRDRNKRSRQEDLCLPLWNLFFFRTLLFTECSAYFPRNNGCCTTSYEVDISFILSQSCIVFSLSATEHIGHLKHVYTLLRDSGATLRSKRCNLFTETIE